MKWRSSKDVVLIFRPEMQRSISPIDVDDTMTADVLAPCVATPPAGMILTWFPRYIQFSAPEELWTWFLK